MATSTNYFINPPYITDRIGYEEQEKMYGIIDKWRPATAKEKARNQINIDDNVLWNQGSRRLELIKDKGVLETGQRVLVGGICSVISSALLMYRTACLWPVTIGTDIGSVDRYKSVWDTAITHKETGLILSFSEHKAAPQLYIDATVVDERGRYTVLEDEPKAFLKDVEELLGIIFSDKCPHPYDGTVAGTCA